MRLSIQVEIQRPRHLPRPRRLLVTLAVALGLLIPAVALAGHQFSDVPDSHLFHNDIARGYGARITAGCTATRFCPDGTVTRGQMMAFMNRGLGRVEYGLLGGSLSSATLANVGSVSIMAGNVTGGQAYVYLIATANAYVNGAGCPCESTISIYRTGGGQVTTQMYMDLVATSPADGDTDEIGTTMGVVAVPTGVVQNFVVMMNRTAGTGNINVYGNVIAMVVPFDGIGVPPGEELPGPLGPVPAKAGEG